MPIPLATAQKYAAHLFNWLQPHCERIAIAGSIRRERPEVGDIDLVVIPRETVYRDMFNVVTGRQNHCWMFLANEVNNSHGRYAWLTGGQEAGRFCSLNLPKCQLDVFFADRETWASVLMCRTGSKEHNIWLAQRANLMGFHWTPSHGLTRAEEPADHPLPPIETPTEDMLYNYLGLGSISPKNRELPWLKANIDSGL